MNRKIITIYFLLGVITNVFIIALPFILADKGFSASQIAIIISITYLASVFQPVVGYFADKTQKPKLILQIGLIAVLVLSLVFTYASSQIIVMISIIIISLFRATFFPLYDNIIATHCQHYALSYGKLRAGASYGFGFGIFLLVPFVLIGGWASSFLLLVVCSIISFYYMFSIDDTLVYQSASKKVSYVEDSKQLAKNNNYMLLIIINVLILALSAIKLTYQSMLLVELDASIIALMLINFMVVLPEVILLPKFDRLYSKTSDYKLFYIATTIIIIHSLLLFITHSIFLIFLVAPLHGYVMSIYLPSFFMRLKRSVAPTISSTAFLFNATIQSLGSYIISGVIMTIIISYYGINMTFLAMAIIASFNYILVYKLKKHQTDK